VIIVVVGFLLPSKVHVERSINIDRPAYEVFGILNDYRYLKHYSQWNERDPDVAYTISGSDSGVGQRLNWLGDPQLVGSGWQQIIASERDRQIDIELHFETQSVAYTRFTLTPDDDGVTVVWSYDADVAAELNFFEGFLSRYFGLLFDRWVGRDFEKGLANLKQYAESQ
jgi:hypothetical protein